MMASPDPFVARMRIFTPPLPRGCERLIEHVSKIRLWSHNQIDHRDVKRSFLEVRPPRFCASFSVVTNALAPRRFPAMLDGRNVPRVYRW